MSVFRHLDRIRPSVIDYSRYPGLTAEKLEEGLLAEKAALKAEGYDAGICFIDQGETAEQTVIDALTKTKFDWVLIGAGVRKDDQAFSLFEILVNIVHKRAPDASICFNTGPTDTVDAIKRWA